MSSNETVADIVREMRNDAIAADAWHETYGEMASAASTLNRHADRVEAAHKRELAAKDAEIIELYALVKELTDALESYIATLRNPCSVSQCEKECKNKIKEFWALVAKARKALEGGEK